MKKFLKNIAALFLVLSLMVSMSGIRIYSHYCESSGYANTSIFKNLAECDHSKVVSCEVKSDDCCSKKSKKFTSDETNNCCHTIEQDLRLSLIFEFSYEKPNIKPIFDFVFEVMENNGQNDEIEINQLLAIHDVFKPPTNRQILILLHKFNSEPSQNC